MALGLQPHLNHRLPHPAALAEGPAAQGCSVLVYAACITLEEAG